MVLVPPELLRSIQSRQEEVSGANVSRIVDLDGELRSILSSTDNPETKFKLYQQTLQRYLFHKEKQRQPLRIELAGGANTTASKGATTLPEETTSDGVDEAAANRNAQSMERMQVDGVLSTIPKKNRAAAKLLINHLNGADGLTWTHSGELIVNGERILDTNIVDLVKDLSHHRPYMELPPGMMPFVAALQRTNVPLSAIANKTLWNDIAQVTTTPARYNSSISSPVSLRRSARDRSMRSIRSRRVEYSPPPPTQRSSHKGYGLALGRWLPYHIK